MKRTSAVAKNYAKALFALAEKGDVVDNIGQEIARFAGVFGAEFAVELKNPAISRQDAVEIATKLCEKLGFKGIFADFVKVVFENKRISEFLAINSEFQALLKKKKGVLEVEVISSEELDDKVVAEIKDLVAKKYDAKEIEVVKTIKNSILGGFQVKVGSNLIDASLKTQLKSLENQLIEAIY